MGRTRRGSGHTWLLRAFAAAVMVCAFTYVPYHVYKRSGFEKLVDLRKDLATLSASNQALKLEIESLAEEAHRLSNDPYEIEKVARHELGWVQPGDIVLDIGDRLP